MSSRKSLCACCALLLVPAVSLAQSEVQTAARPNAEVTPKIERGSGTHPNDVLRFSTRFLEPILGQFAQQVDKTSPTRDWVLEAFSVGTARTRGESWIEVVPNAERATFRFHFKGQINGRATAYRDPVRLSTRTSSRIDVSKWIQLGAEGVVPHPAQADCRTHVEYLDCQTDIKGPLRKSLVTKLGMKKAQKKETDAEAVVAGKFERRFESKVDEQIDSQLAELSSYYIDYHTDPLKQYGVEPEISSATTSNGLELRFRNIWREQTGAPGPQPKVKPHDFCGLVHESALNALGGAYVCGSVWQDSDFESVLKEMTGEVPRAVRAGSHTVRWSVRFADKDPLTCRLADGAMEITFRVSEYTVGETTREDPFVVNVRYKMKPTVWGPEFNRQGRVRFTFAGDKSEAPNADAAYVQSKIEAFWREQIYMDGVVPPAGGSWDQFRKLHVAELWIRDGWFVMGYDLPEEKK